MIFADTPATTATPCAVQNAAPHAINVVRPVGAEKYIETNHKSGVVDIKVYLGADGTVIKAVVYHSSGDTFLDGATYDAAIATAYAPEIKDCVAIAGAYIYRTKYNAEFASTTATNGTPAPTAAPSPTPTPAPDVAPSPAAPPTPSPSLTPTPAPSPEPPTVATAVPDSTVTMVPTTFPTTVATTVPTTYPTKIATSVPTTIATSVPTTIATSYPTTIATRLPTSVPTTIETTVPGTIQTTIPKS